MLLIGRRAYIGTLQLQRVYRAGRFILILTIYYRRARLKYVTPMMCIPVQLNELFMDEKGH